jgi:hypothetical protein
MHVTGLLKFLSPEASYCQSISKVHGGSKPTPEPRKAEYTLRITGNAFGTDKNKASVLVSAKGTLFHEPVVSDVSAGGS